MAAVRRPESVRVPGGGILRRRGDESGSETVLAAPLASRRPRALSRARNSRPKRRPNRRRRTPWGPAISSVFEGGFVLSFATGGEGDLSVLVSLPEARQAMYEMRPWPVITEFRSMLQNGTRAKPNSFWQGRWFLATRRWRPRCRPSGFAARVRSRSGSRLRNGRRSRRRFAVPGRSPNCSGFQLS